MLLEIFRLPPIVFLEADNIRIHAIDEIYYFKIYILSFYLPVTIIESMGIKRKNTEIFFSNRFFLKPELEETSQKKIPQDQGRKGHY
ncbi:MAG: hypothetical protein HKN61_07360 [Flavobacteriaceae bacterium]|nr:hypothetical protein [Flavobacteriaceae bacterium]